ncbi:MAG: UDP-N-acetylmuramoyl-tripeptide--D-alanyl-D-alanine ligase [Defluviitaleaceae bacterium]|nr:UDP-N-acetylmuramoyl-tripeptide--D-alanyl-D-alanine ligase [Defluviitaleaceae bacterium]MCL2264321.1 UDP-N-acetylmuramoyl-tripeptide--D-alanyl-D-alanine ligase [Defluviitaleaceae bacterium]
MKLEISEIIHAVGGRLLGEVDTGKFVTGISTDTRTIKEGSLFVPIAGDNFDGHDYIMQASEKGAICVLTERQSQPTDMAFPLIYVSSTRRALMDLADYYRRKCGVKVVAVTGSAGKTTTKDMMADILSQKFRTKRTIKNFNNDIGMPLSIFQLEPDDEVLVLEMGMNHANEIHELSLVGEPDIAVITHIGDAHIENFENREGILHAKLEIVDGLRPTGTVVLNGDDPLLTGAIAAEKTAQFNVLYPSTKNIVSAEPIGFQETRCTFTWHGEEIRLTVPIPGAHMVMNALLATVVGLEMGVSPAKITTAFENFTPPEGRLNIFESNGKTIIDDVYNANPSSMFEAIKVLCRKTPENENRRRVAILGDMNELGHVAEDRHREVGEFAARSNLDLLITIGDLSLHTFNAFSDNEDTTAAIHFVTLPDFLAETNILQPNDIVLVKASRGMNFEKIIQAIG